jgi:ABC-type nitrate/sulfonate/bicarbonate transport system substrate-binding protein
MKRLIGALVATLTFATVAQAEPLKLRIQYSGASPGMFGPMLEGITKPYKHYGQSYVIESVSMRGSGAAITALAAREIEIGAISYEGLTHAIVTAQLDLRVIADVLAAGVNGHLAAPFMVRKGEIRRIEDLKGKVVSTPTRGSTADTAIAVIAAKHGLKHNVDYTVVEVPFPAMLPGLDSKRIDLAYVVPPWHVIGEKSGKYDTLFTIADAVGPTQSLVWMAHADLIAKNRAAMVDFMEDHLRFRRWVFDPANRAEMLRETARIAKQPVENLDWAFTKKDHYRAPDAKPDLALLQKNIDMAKEQGLAPGRFDIAPKYVDLSLIDDALKRLD